MELITKESVAATAASRWKLQYCHGDKWSVLVDKRSSEDVYLRLVALGKSPSSEAVNSVIGNDSWGSAPNCDECGARKLDAVVQVGEEPDYESATAYLCLECVKKLTILATPGGGDAA